MPLVNGTCSSSAGAKLASVEVNRIHTRYDAFNNPLGTASARGDNNFDRVIHFGMPETNLSLSPRPMTYNPIESHRLHIFHAMAQTGCVAEAARQMCLTRSALSHALRTLESELGCELFSRSERKLSLTSAGIKFLPHARTILDQMQTARRSLQEHVA